MCGRYATNVTPAALETEFAVGVANSFVDLEPSYNVAPTDTQAIVVARPDDDGVVQRQLRAARWGLVPSWAKDPKIGNRMINARVETVAEKPAYKKAFASRRAIVPATGYYEWYVKDDGGKQPFFIRPKDGSPLAMAGLYEFWKAPDGEWLVSFTVITTTAEDSLGRIHDRMPFVVERDTYEAWLDPTASGPELLDLLVPAAPGRLDAYPVSPAVGNVRHDSPELIEPLPAA